MKPKRRKISRLEFFCQLAATRPDFTIAKDIPVAAYAAKWIEHVHRGKGGKRPGNAKRDKHLDEDELEARAEYWATMRKEGWRKTDAARECWKRYHEGKPEPTGTKKDPSRGWTDYYKSLEKHCGYYGIDCPE